ncbi:hypothetical protein LMG31884_47310 (plasmid) [Xanthomonas hydrangeae]|uniref:hypothetical protein n=1 Tax=Xanthomonas hydrangeae TaxID=2775159 RepID=UPI001964DCEC|nr:hypothetical protein LMG31884_47310 [Xanthomonas hydrangeae]CAD7741127.1 hypothetical protein LMG31884_47310 [Xanthomonas hydrangeae]CAD7747958.1 hypothetical protein LMG31887_46500 [Xanthomonas hydrangeae]CAD7747959.1 hypothetical protein LMG31887_46500 [Xanthomonas hydrangeae]CAD7748164.1 hypothetical protein LMG31885_44990 [Xanthomonas hydrangeae]
MTDNIFALLAEAEAIRVNGKVTARHPGGAPLDGLLALRDACKRHGPLLANRRRTSFAEWATLIDHDPLAGIDSDQASIAQALRDMQAAAQPAPAPVNLIERLRRLGRPVAEPAT